MQRNRRKWLLIFFGLAGVYLGLLVFGRLNAGRISASNEMGPVGENAERKPERHPWIKRPSIPATERNWRSGIQYHPQSVLDEWTEIPRSTFESVRLDKGGDVTALLKDKSVVPVSREQVRRWCDTLADTSPTLSAFLVRGLSYDPESLHGSPHQRAFLFFKPANRELWVQTIYGTGEFFPDFSTIKTAPFVVLLDAPPARISVTAHKGGDDAENALMDWEGAKRVAFWFAEADIPLNERKQ